MKRKVPVKEKLGDFFIDIAKLVFGGVVLSLIISFEANKVFMLVCGIIATAVIAGYGFYLIYKQKK
jgi:hypothetical protein